MAVSKSQQKAVNKYVREKYDRINITMQKGKKDTLQAHAAARGESANSFINRAIDQAMERDGGGTAPGAAPVEHVLAEMPAERPQKAVESTQGGGVVSLPYETPEAAQRVAEQPQRPVYDAEGVNRVLPINVLKKAQEAADKRGESLPLFLAIAMEMRIDAEAEGSVTMPPEALQAAQEAAEARRETVSRFLTRAINTQIEKDKYERYRQDDQRRGK